MTGQSYEQFDLGKNSIHSSMWRCMPCGSLVVNKDAHDEWHQRIDDLTLILTPDDTTPEDGA